MFLWIMNAIGVELSNMSKNSKYSGYIAACILSLLLWGALFRRVEAQTITTNPPNRYGISTNRLDWPKTFGHPSIAGLNSKCDLLVIGSIDNKGKVIGNYLVTDIAINSVLAAKATNAALMSSEYFHRKMTNAYLYHEVQKSPHSIRAQPTLLQGGKFLLWLNIVEAPSLFEAAEPTSPLSKNEAAKTLPTPRIAVTGGFHGAYLLSGIELLQERHKILRFPLYPWQEQFLEYLVKTNDAWRFKRIAVDVARALKNDKTSSLLLQSMAKNPTDPIVAGIAKEHLDKGITNIFNYVNPDLIP